MGTAVALDQTTLEFERDPETVATQDAVWRNGRAIRKLDRVDDAVERPRLLIGMHESEPVCTDRVGEIATKEAGEGLVGPRESAIRIEDHHPVFDRRGESVIVR